MDCDTTGVEPDFALVKFKKLAGGGYFKIANQSLAPALRNLGYTDTEIHDVLRFHLKRKRVVEVIVNASQLKKIVATYLEGAQTIISNQQNDGSTPILHKTLSMAPPRGPTAQRAASVALV